MPKMRRDYIQKRTTIGISLKSMVLLKTPSGEDLTPKVNAKMAEFKGMFASVIIGSKSFEDFDKYIEQYKKEIGNDMTEAANRLYLKQWQ